MGMAKLGFLGFPHFTATRTHPVSGLAGGLMRYLNCGNLQLRERKGQIHATQ
jgi:hypothetical protein